MGYPVGRLCRNTGWLADSASCGALLYFKVAFYFAADAVLLFYDQNYGIHYEYTIPVNYTTENQSGTRKTPGLLVHLDPQRLGRVQCSVAEVSSRVVGSLGVGFYQAEEK